MFFVLLLQPTFFMTLSTRQLMETLQVLQSKSERVTLEQCSRKRKCCWRPLEWLGVTAPQHSLAPSSYKRCRYTKWCDTGCLELTCGDVTYSFILKMERRWLGSAVCQGTQWCVYALKVCSQLGHNVVYQAQSTGLVQDNTLSNTRLVPDLV